MPTELHSRLNATDDPVRAATTITTTTTRPAGASVHGDRTSGSRPSPDDDNSAASASAATTSADGPIRAIVAVGVDRTLSQVTLGFENDNAAAISANAAGRTAVPSIATRRNKPRHVRFNISEPKEGEDGRTPVTAVGIWPSASTTPAGEKDRGAVSSVISSTRTVPSASTASSRDASVWADRIKALACYIDRAVVGDGACRAQVHRPQTTGIERHTTVDRDVCSINGAVDLLRGGVRNRAGCSSPTNRR